MMQSTGERDKSRGVGLKTSRFLIFPFHASPTPSPNHSLHQLLTLPSCLPTLAGDMLVLACRVHGGSQGAMPDGDVGSHGGEGDDGLPRIVRQV